MCLSTKKRSGEIKARKVAGGNKHQHLILKEDASSPTFATESVLLSCVINAKENRDVAITDIPNAFIQTVVKDLKDRAITHIHALMVDMFMKIAPDVYENYITIDKKCNKQLLMECLNALYGTIVVGLLYHQKFTKSLKEQGYMMNPYNPCVWNKMINGKQLTICFHVDDCKILHVSPKVVDETLDWLHDNYESIFEDGSGKMKVH